MPKSPTKIAAAADAKTDVESPKAEEKEREYKPSIPPNSNRIKAIKIQHDGKEIEWKFRLKRIADNGECGFLVFGYDREQVKNKILAFLDDNTRVAEHAIVLKPIADEIKAKLRKSVKFLPQPLLDDIKEKGKRGEIKNEGDVLNYCQTKEFVYKYLKDYLSNGWASDDILFALAEVDRIQIIYCRDIDESGKPIHVIYNSYRPKRVGGPIRVVVIYHTIFDHDNRPTHKNSSGDPLHYDLLEPIDEAGFYAACNVPNIPSINPALADEKDDPIILRAWQLQQLRESLLEQNCSAEERKAITNVLTKMQLTREKFVAYVAESNLIKKTNAEIIAWDEYNENILVCDNNYLQRAIYWLDGEYFYEAMLDASIAICRGESLGYLCKAQAWYELGLINEEHQVNFFDFALLALTQLFDVEANRGFAFLLRAKIYLKKFKYEEALKDAKKAQELDKNLYSDVQKIILEIEEEKDDEDDSKIIKGALHHPKPVLNEGPAAKRVKVEDEKSHQPSSATLVGKIGFHQTLPAVQLPSKVEQDEENTSKMQLN